MLATLKSPALTTNIDTRGFMMGRFQKLNFIGRTKKIIEGELLLGRDSFAVQDYDFHKKNHKQHIENPRLFCAELRNFYEIEKLVGKYVIVEYKTPRKSTLIKCKAGNELVKIYPVKPYNSDVKSYRSKSLSLGTQSPSISVGRIVNTVESGKHRVTWRLILQDGNGGNQFTLLNIADNGLYDFSVKALKYGDMVKVYCIDRFFNRSIRRGNPGLYVWKIETLDDI